MLIAQISDLHIRLPGQKTCGVVDTAAFLPPVLARINRLRPRPDCVLVTGDLTDFGKPEAYAYLRKAMQALAIPYYLIPGNHDDRANLADAFPDHAYLREAGRYIQYTVEHYPLRIIALDTVVPMQGHGALCAERLDWLAARLAEQPERPTVIIMHHPPFVTGMRHMDAIGLLAGSAELESIVRRHPNVERMMCGHLHRTIFRRFGGTIASTCPATAHQIALDLDQGNPLCFIMEPPAYQLHAWLDGQLVTHHAVVGDYGGPRSFKSDDNVDATM